eukprot:6093328-Pyramimonas_sp.AAC.2
MRKGCSYNKLINPLKHAAAAAAADDDNDCGVIGPASCRVWLSSLAWLPLQLQLQLQLPLQTKPSFKGPAGRGNKRCESYNRRRYWDPASQQRPAGGEVDFV